MFDTIHLTVNDLKVHSQLYSELLKQKTTSKNFSVDSKRPLSKRPTFLQIDRDILFMETTGKAVEKFRATSMNAMSTIASSHYKLIIFVDTKDDCINFNFSIPKYFYGTNVFQAVPHWNEKDFQLCSDSLAYNSSIAFKRLKMYINAFFIKQFPSVNIDFNYVQLKRFDLCFNLFFDSKKSALDYLEHQRSVPKANLRATNGASNNYQTSIFYSNKSYSCKVYHKGAEFFIKDRKELDKVNLQAMGGYGSKRFDAKKKIFDTEALQDIADKILRFEMTFRSSYISEIFNAKVLKKHGNNIEFKRLKEIYNKIYSISVKLHDVKDFTTGKPMVRDGKYVRVPIGIGSDHISYYRDLIKNLQNSFSESTGECYFDIIQDFGGVVKYQDNENFYMKVLSSFHNKFNAFLAKKHCFVFRNDYEDRQLYDSYLNHSADLKHLHYVKMSDSLMRECFNKFYSFVDDFKLCEAPSMAKFKAAVDTINSERKPASRVSTQTCVLMYALMQKGHSMKTLSSLLELSDNTYYKYKRFFKDCGVVKQSSAIVFNPDYSHDSYYREVNNNNLKKYLDFKFI